MPFPLATAVVPSLVVLSSTPSTNGELATRATDDTVADFTTVVTEDQTAGRGRLGRIWSAPSGTALAVSVLVRNPGPALGWLSIAAGVAMSEAISGFVTAALAGFKWPNDVLIKDRKVCGILAEVLPDGSVVIGVGVNVRMSAQQLPVPTATSLLLEGVDPSDDLADRVLAAYLARLTHWVTALRTSQGDASAAGLSRAAVALCVTLGRSVRVELPGGRELRGTALDLDDEGRLVVQTGDGGTTTVAAGDVTHVR